MSLLMGLALVLTIVALLVAALYVWEGRRERQRQERIRARGNDATIQTEHPQKETGHWNLT